MHWRRHSSPPEAAGPWLFVPRLARSPDLRVATRRHVFEEVALPIKDGRSKADWQEVSPDADERALIPRRNNNFSPFRTGLTEHG